MTKWKRVTIVGVGLLGGSIGLALKEKGLAEEIIGYGRSNERLQLAKELGAVTETTLDLAEAVSQTELIVICSPVQMIAQQVKQIIPLCIEKVLITDVGSTKTTICQQLENHSSEFATFIGSHPLAGSEKSGVLHSQANLFEQKQVILTPHPNRQSNAQYQEQLTQLVNFWEALGANVSQMSPEDHDCLAAQISHLPHLIASALVRTTNRESLPWVASGWKSTTRIASGDTELWKQIIAENRTPILEQLKQYIEQLTTIEAALETNELEPIHQLLQTGKDRRDSVGN